MHKRVLVITGSPCVGKTTVLTKTVSLLRGRGFRIGGMLSKEVREGGARVGFEIFDIAGEKRGWLAHVNQETGPSLGKYRVNLRDLEDIGANAIIGATENCEIIVIDEIGPMELFSPKFKNAAKRALQSRKLVIAVVHSKADDELIKSVKTREDTEIFEVTHENRENLARVITEKAL